MTHQIWKSEKAIRSLYADPATFYITMIPTQILHLYYVHSLM